MRVSILDSCQERFLWTHKEVGFAPHPVVGLVLQVGETEKFPPALCFESLDPFFIVRKQGSCFTTIEEDVQVDEALIFLSSFSVAFREEKRERGRYIYTFILFFQVLHFLELHDFLTWVYLHCLVQIKRENHCLS